METARENRRSVDGRTTTERAAMTAAALLKAYYLQDEREGFLLRGRPEEAANAGAQALEHMAATYETEFPHVDRRHARSAGEAFMRALFVQDEIENWGLLKRVPACDLKDVLVSDPNERYGSDPVEDGRWETVRKHLSETCRGAHIDERYADRQTRFWLLHGQSDRHWGEVAFEAHGFKLRAMVDDPPESATERMGRWFVDGVKLHDEWGHRNESADVDRAIDLVAEYYRELFALRSGDR